MVKPKTRTHARYSTDAVMLMGRLIQSARKERKLTSQELAERAGISRGLLQRIEKGDLSCGIGAVFEVASIVGVSLFDADASSLSKHIKQVEDRLTLLPGSVRKTSRMVKDDF